MKELHEEELYIHYEYDADFEKPENFMMRCSCNSFYSGGRYSKKKVKVEMKETK